MLLSYVISSGALESPGLLLSYSVMTLALHSTIILTIIPKFLSFIHTLNQLIQVQVMNLKLTEEVERFESMLKLQSGINRDLHKELEVLIHKRDSDKKIHAKRAGEFRGVIGL
mgnify:FL=1